MSLEGLDAILTKEEIVETQRPADLVDRAEMVDSTYTRHVRSYIPLGRQAQGGDSNQSVSSFEKRVIREVKAAAALRGYITAEYGYGKTSTALYLWKQAREANVLAVPPFKMTQLSDLITATYGWLSYELKRTRPQSALVQEAQSLYSTVIDRSAESLAKQYNIDRAGVQRLVLDRPELLILNTADYLRFFEEATRISREAGFDGLLVLADEVQQYIDPEIKTGVKDPISPLFELISGLITRRNHLHLGMIFILPPTDLDILRDQRGDFVHRMLQVSLDLRSIYDRDFASRLWQRLAEEFEFTDHCYRIVNPLTLDALGQIAVRTDLSDGPRTVINTFRHMTKRYIELGHPDDEPYSPYHLIEDFLNSRITFDSAKKIPKVTNQALSHSLVKGFPDRERAIKWAAAFPEEGVPRELQTAQNLEKAFDDLMQSAQGDLVIAVGDIKKRGITLRGLDQVKTEIDWLSVTIREFWRLYDENIETTKQRAVRGFSELLTTKVFPENQWKVLEQVTAGLTRNDSLILEGSFTSYSRKYPERRIHVRILWEDETVKDVDSNGEFLIQFRLKRYLDWSEQDRRLHSEALEINYDARQINVTLNLMYRDEANISPTLDNMVSPIVSPYKLTPLLMLALHETINEKRAKNAIPKSDDQTVRYAFQPDLLDNVFRFFFNQDVGKPVNAAEERILEEATSLLLKSMYPDYETLMLVANWTSSLAKYRNALKHLEYNHEKQGQVTFDGTKEEIAELFALKNTGLDSFISNFSVLLLVQQPFPTQREVKEGKKGRVRFQLHPLEQQIRKWLADSSDTHQLKMANKIHTVHTIPTNQIYRKAGELGYHHKEVDEVLNLMSDRALIVQVRGEIREEINLAPSIDDLVADIEAWQKDVAKLLEVFNQHQLRSWAEEAEKALVFVNQELRQKLDEEKAIGARRKVQSNRHQLEEFVKDRHQDLVRSIRQFERNTPQLNPLHIKTLTNPVQGQVSYVEQVNDIRSRVLRQFNTLAREVASYREQIKSLAASLETDNLEITTLVKLAEEYKTLQSNNEPLQEKVETATKDFNMFTEWGRLVKDGSDLSEQIQELSDAVRDERAKFQKLSQDIMGHLSANKTAALPDAPTFENQLREIAEAVRAIKAEASNRFADLQERYRHILMASLKFPRERLWSPYPYNPTDPDDSYRRLTQDVETALQDLHQRLKTKLAELQDEVRRILQDPSLKTMTTEDKNNIETNGNSLLKEFKLLSSQFSELQLKLNDDLIVNDFPEEGEGKFHKLITAFQQPHERLLDHVAKDVKQLSSTLRITAPSDEEKMVLDILLEADQIEYSELRQRVSLSEDELWQALHGLYSKRRIRLPIQPIK
jgi:hypothetical protein